LSTSLLASSSLPLHDALPISSEVALTSVANEFQPIAVDWIPVACAAAPKADARTPDAVVATWPRLGPAGRLPPTAVLWSPVAWRSEEHTSELQSRENLVCRLL